MIEAYEIGIKLALQDGVSEGIAAIRRDLGSLDQAIAQTTLRLSQLQQIGAQALMALQERPEQVTSGLLVRRPAPAVTPAPVVEPEPVAPPVEAQTATSTQVPPPRPQAGPPAVLTATRVPSGEPGLVSPPVVTRLDVAAPAVAAPPPAVVVDAVRAPGGPRPPEQPAATSLASIVPPAPLLAAAAITRLIAPKLQDGDPLSKRDERTRELAMPRPARRVLPALESEALAPHKAVTEPGRREKARQPMHRHGEVREIHARQSAAASDLPAARVVPAPATPAAIFSPVSSVAPPALPSYAPPAASPRARETSMRGDVFFDGTRVGRWMSEQMARDAGRPNTGPTGFDPRRSPAWPGAAVTW